MCTGAGESSRVDRKGIPGLDLEDSGLSRALVGKNFILVKIEVAVFSV